jgi:hypothetical protein
MSKGEQIRDSLPVETMAEYIVLTVLQNKICGVIFWGDTKKLEKILNIREVISGI